MNTELSSFVEALKINYNQNPRSYRLILQDIYSWRNVSTIKADNWFTREGPYPIEGIFNTDGKLFI